jgi:peptidoglycan/LPS O-acetylase OafA/YrhL
LREWSEPSSGDATRLAGLDTLRALAIAFVFCHHYQLFVSGEPSFGWFGTVGWVGVDLFFVLSGYLIGHQLLAGASQGRTISLRGFWSLCVEEQFYLLLPLLLGLGLGTLTGPCWSSACWRSASCCGRSPASTTWTRSRIPCR